MKKNILYVFTLIAVLLTYGFLAWAVMQHGTAGLLRVNGLFKWIFIVMALAAVILIIATVLRAWFIRKNHKIVTVILTVPVVFLIIFNSVIPAAAFVFIGGPQTAINVQPQLLLGYGTGKYGVPNVMVVTSSDKPQNYAIDWGISTTTSVTVEAKPSIQHTFLLSDLLPDTEYWFQFGKSKKYYFRTPSIDKTDLHFAVGSDAHFGAGNNWSDLTVKMLEQIGNSADRYDFFFSLGDNVEYGFRNSMWNEALECYSTHLEGIPIGFVTGNHDTLFTGLQKYEKYCRSGAPETPADGSLWYRIDAGKVHLLVLDVEWSAESYPEEQTAWLEKQLSAIPSEDWIIVLSHGFYYSSGFSILGWDWYDNPETINLYTPLFERYGVDMVFSGHIHQLELLEHSGVTYIVGGGLGGKLEPGRTYISPASLWYGGDQYGYADVTVTDESASIVFRDPDNQVLKQYTIANDR